jgi:hypothetical protein
MFDDFHVHLLLPPRQAHRRFQTPTFQILGLELSISTPASRRAHASILTTPPPSTTAAAMPKFFCDYCDVYLTHDSMSVRKAHNSGRNHLRNVQAYYEQISSDQTQQVINSITDAYSAEGQANPLYAANLSGGYPGGPMAGMPMPGGPMGMPMPGGKDLVFVVGSAMLMRSRNARNATAVRDAGWARRS